jgi:hypothetical protein
LPGNLFAIAIISHGYKAMAGKPLQQPLLKAFLADAGRELVAKYQVY